jgi:hypothetical protein
MGALMEGATASELERARGRPTFLRWEMTSRSRVASADKLAL